MSSHGRKASLTDSSSTSSPGSEPRTLSPPAEEDTKPDINALNEFLLALGNEFEPTAASMWDDTFAHAKAPAPQPRGQLYPALDSLFDGHDSVFNHAAPSRYNLPPPSIAPSRHRDPIFTHIDYTQRARPATVESVDLAQPVKLPSLGRPESASRTTLPPLRDVMETEQLATGVDDLSLASPPSTATTIGTRRTHSQQRDRALSPSDSASDASTPTIHAEEESSSSESEDAKPPHKRTRLAALAFAAEDAVRQRRLEVIKVLYARVQIAYRQALLA